MVPSLTSAVYFFVFLGLCTWWSCCQAFDPLIFSCLCVLMAIFSAGHLIGLYLYQLQFFQEVVPPKDFYARWAKFLSCLIVGAWCNALLSHVDAKALPHNVLTNFTRNFMFSLGRVEAFQAAWFGMRVVQVPPGQLYAESWDRVGGKVILVFWSEWSSDVSVNLLRQEIKEVGVDARAAYTQVLVEEKKCLEVWCHRVLPGAKHVWCQPRAPRWSSCITSMLCVIVTRRNSLCSCRTRRSCVHTNSYVT